MADKMMRVAGRTSGGTAVPMLAGADGSIATTRKWKKEWVTIQSSMEIRDTNAVILDPVDVSEIPIFSLRILNRLGVQITLKFKTDINTTNGYNLADKDGTDFTFTIQPTNSYVVITPDELPILNYIRYLRITVIPVSAPVSGTFEAHMVKIS